MRNDPDEPGYATIPPGADAFDPDFLRAHVEDDPGDWRRWFLLGRVLARGDTAAAARAFARVIRLAPGNGRAHLELALCLPSDDPARLRRLKAATRLRPDLPLAWALLGHEWSGRDRYDAALEAQRQVLELTPGDSQAWWAVSRCLLRLGRVREAVVTLEETVKRQPEHLPALRALAYLLHHRGERDETDRFRRRLYALDEDYARALDAELAGRPTAAQPDRYEPDDRRSGMMG